MAQVFDLIIIGAGPGGYEAAFDAAEKGMNVAIVEKEAMGGTCLNHGCIPTKTLIHSAEVYKTAKESDLFGVETGDVSFQMDKIIKRKNDVLAQLREGIEGLIKKKKIQNFQGQGIITGPHQVKVNDEVLEAKNILIATGSSVAVPPIEGMDLPNVVTSDELLEKADGIFENLVIIGGGVIGMEFASIFSALGAKVTVIEALDRILANMDKEIAQNLKMILKKRDVAIHTGAKVAKIEKVAGGKLLCSYTEKGSLNQIEADGILVAVGRKPNTKGLFGEGFDVSTERGRILVDDYYKTSVDSIYAIGDVIGGIMLAHVATAEGRNAVAYINGDTANVNTNVVPGCVYTNPEIGSVGLSADEAKKAGISVVTRKYIMSANGKSILANEERGFIKIVAKEESGMILGAQMMCARATDMIEQFATAIVSGQTVDDLAKVIAPHPTFSEGISEAVRIKKR